MKSTFVLAATALLLWSAAPAQAQRKGKAAASAPTEMTVAARRLQPLFGGLTPAQAEQLLGAPYLTSLAGSFASRTEASRFFSTKGYEYLSESQPDTAAYRFNLAWVLDPKNPDAYRGLGIVASRNPTPDEAISLLTQGMALAPTNSYLLSDLGTSYLIRYEQGKKKKDLTTGIELLEKATTQDGTNAVAWQQLGRGYYYQEKYEQAWGTIHKAQSTDMSAIDFSLVSDLLARLPDPQGKFK
ncbi:tetratricopeptide (TPR) repeat protein [Hymenobacter luteus]|uniref:Tetratricopeptide (TPR) repeat protein n=2 Tax=Hymenobacter TaxID=89966 RepID=A0A7W9WAL9_9BACT|nr:MULTISPECIES: hypothetical protein [Hymenobacter]MBB4599602.1 tetratricopeptide (TPR) repeat protein [Hymenobacter latericoloratus]MBB6058088.1 tetratricopeptide (TPR) repeat protein [Hymenobacter luteus]